MRDADKPQPKVCHAFPSNITRHSKLFGVEIARATGYAVEIRIIDLADFSSVISFAEELKDTPIDILVANAGLAHWDYIKTKDDWEET